MDSERDRTILSLTCWLVIAGACACSENVARPDGARSDGPAGSDGPKSDGPIATPDRRAPDWPVIRADADGGATKIVCPGHLAPVPTPNAKVVGTGTAASCTEQALRAALDAAKTAGGGTITFNCGGKHTITIASRLVVGSSKTGTVIIDGGGLITISGGGKTRVFDLDNYTNFVVQRLTIADGFVAAGEPKETNKPQNSIDRFLVKPMARPPGAILIDPAKKSRCSTCPESGRNFPLTTCTGSHHGSTRRFVPQCRHGRSSCSWL